MSSPDTPPPNELGQVLVNFSELGAYPDDESTSAALVEDSVLLGALEILQNAKDELEAEIKQISRESAPDVDNWIENAKSIQNEIQESRKLASSITRKAQEDEQRLETLKEQEAYAQFLEKEVAFQDQLLASLTAIDIVNQQITEAEVLATRSQITEAHHILEAAITAMQALSMDVTTQPMKLLSLSAKHVRSMIHNQFIAAWKSLVTFDKKTLTIHKLVETNSDIAMVYKGLQAYGKDVVEAQNLWARLDSRIIGPRTNVNEASPPSIQVKRNTLYLDGGTTDRTIKSLFFDLQQIVEFFNKNLPPELTMTFAQLMMPPLSRHILETWLDAAVPASLDDMVDYQKTLAIVHAFASKLDGLNWPGSGIFHDWVASAPKIWLNKRRETTLDWTRNQLSLGIGPSVVAQRVEKQMVARDEAKELAAATAGSEVTQEWDSAWDSDDDEDEPVPSGERNRLSLEEERLASEIKTPQQTLSIEDEDDGADAWGWGDDNDVEADVVTQDPEPTILRTAQKSEPANSPNRPFIPQTTSTREITLSEKYWISSVPQPVFNSIKKLYNDAAKLTQPETEHIPISAAAPGLFSLPTLVLAMYRAISPSYYTTQRGGNMFLYNDAMWLSESFGNFITEWNGRSDLTPRAYGMVKLEPEIKVLTSFGKRAYTNELIEQRTIINDLLGGASNFFQQDVLPGKDSFNDSIDLVISHVHDQAEVWKTILPYSAWASATGSLVNTIAIRIIADVFDLSDISVDEAERIATVISRVETLDKLFLMQDILGKRVSSAEADVEPIPSTSKFADKWMKMKFLSEVLQSNLAEVKYLWFESDLSLYFSVDEVVEIVGLSFQRNKAVRDAIKEIREKPDPKGLGA